MEIQTGEKLFQFQSKADWINRANKAFRDARVDGRHAVCVDTAGRICGWGEHFRIAEETQAYPITVYRLRPDMTPNV